MSVKFTQFILPHGRTREITISLAPEVETKADKLLQRGYNFEIEILSTGQISATINHSSLDYDAAITVCNNNAEVPLAISKMLMEFNPFL